MTLDPSVPAHLVEPVPEDYEPRASRLVAPSLTSVRAELWMGGVHTALGSQLVEAQLRAAWVVDCAGELPPGLLGRAGRHLPRVFADIEAVPTNLVRIHALVDEVAEAVSGSASPERVYVMCKQGLNRSGLVSALLLRALGTPGDEALRIVRAARPGALNNVVFERLVRGDSTG